MTPMASAPTAKAGTPMKPPEPPNSWPMLLKTRAAAEIEQVDDEEVGDAAQDGRVAVGEAARDEAAATASPRRRASR